jgi:6,7-dimethyl-8-ribityllumazine synthase
VPVDVDDHAPAELQIPGGYRTLEGEASGEHLAVALVVSRFNGEITNRLLKRALEELDACGVAKDAVTITVVPGAFELPLAAMALAKTRRYGCVVALGCVIRGKTRHFEYISSEAASGLQLAALETGTPVSFGVLTLENRKQAELRIDRAADAVHSALEMASMFAQLRATAQH